MRGVIKNVERSQQIVDYRNLLYGRITPTDMDGMIEYKDKAYIFLEIKYMDKDLPRGQRIALERLVRDTEKAGKESIAIVAEHEIHDVAESILADTCKVREICYKQDYRWRPPKFDCTVKQMVDSFIGYADRDISL